MSRNRGNIEHGFTLIEIIIAVTILSLIVLALYGAFNVTTTIIRAGTQKHETLQYGRLALEAIRKDLLCALPVQDKANQTFRGIHNSTGFYDQDAIDFLTASNILSEPGENKLESDIVEIGYFISEEYPERGYLVRRIDLTTDKSPFSGGKIDVIAENVVGLNFEYHTGKEWVESWDPEAEEKDDQQTGLPAMVVIEVTVRDENEEYHTVATTVLLAMSEREIEELNPEDEDEDEEEQEPQQ